MYEKAKVGQPLSLISGFIRLIPEVSASQTAGILYVSVVLLIFSLQYMVSRDSVTLLTPLLQPQAQTRAETHTPRVPLFVSPV